MNALDRQFSNLTAQMSVRTPHMAWPNNTYTLHIYIYNIYIQEVLTMREPTSDTCTIYTTQHKTTSSFQLDNSNEQLRSNWNMLACKVSDNPLGRFRFRLIYGGQKWAEKFFLVEEQMSLNNTLKICWNIFFFK